MDRTGWSTCKVRNTYIQGLWRNDNKGHNDGLQLVERAYCCSSKYSDTTITCKGGNLR